MGRAPCASLQWGAVRAVVAGQRPAKHAHARVSTGRGPRVAATKLKTATLSAHCSPFESDDSAHSVIVQPDTRNTRLCNSPVTAVPTINLCPKCALCVLANVCPRGGAGGAPSAADGAPAHARGADKHGEESTARGQRAELTGEGPRLLSSRVLELLTPLASGPPFLFCFFETQTIAWQGKDPRSVRRRCACLLCCSLALPWAPPSQLRRVTRAGTRAVVPSKRT